MKLNKGEWSEPYVALRLLGDGKLNIADENGRPKLGEWMDILELFRKETELRMVTYVRDSEVNVVDIDVNGARVASLPVSEFLEAADRLASEILNGKGSSFEASSEMKDFFLRAKMIFLKAKSIDKSDILLTVRDPRSSITREKIGFSIKSKFGKNPTLFNTAHASGVRYKLNGCTRDDMNEINEILDAKGHVAVTARCEEILKRGIEPEYDGYAIAQRAGCEACRENLEVINERLPQVIERMLWNHFFEGFQPVDIPDVVEHLIVANPCGITRPEIKYPYMVKAFIYAAYCGLTASTLWDGRSQVNGGFIAVDENGGVLAHYALESEEFKGYLYNNCYLEFPSTSKGHGDYAYIYEKNGEYYFHLNFQIRYR
ncbi:MAG: HpaII family restriction endonuclease [Collinsella sp.]|nr:HpaII family restriction endonuclease [Collinsella sp.]